MSFIVENIRLKELAIIAESNKDFFLQFVSFLNTAGYSSLYDFVMEKDNSKATSILLKYFTTPLPAKCHLYDGVARPYQPDKAKWLMLGWIFRDAPEQRLKPMLGSIYGQSLNHKRAGLFNQLREHVALIFPERDRWEWIAVSEVVIDRLEGSRRSIKAHCLRQSFAEASSLFSRQRNPTIIFHGKGTLPRKAAHCTVDVFIT